MKKVLAIVLALAMILGSFSFVAADTATNSDVAGTKYEGAVAVLGALGVVSGYPDGTFKPEKVVTRAEMCKLIINALGLDEYVAGSYAGYPDVAGSHWATSYIAYATSLGVINGYPDGTFKPENPVTYQEAAAMLVRALGYQDKYLIGSWPASHVNVAVSEGLLKGVKATAEGATRGDIALMFFNALPVKMVKYDKWEQVGQTTDTMLTRMDAKVAKEQIFDQELAHAALVQFGIDLSDYVGAKVDYYWIDAAPAETAEGDAPILPDTDAKDAPIAIAKEYGTLLTGEYKAANSVDSATFVVGDTTYKFASGITPETTTNDFYNGSNVDSDETNDIVVLDEFTGGEICTLAVKLNGVWIEDVYSVSVWEATEEVQWDEDYADTLADDKLVAGYACKKTNTEAIDYSWLILEGVEDLATIAKDSIVTVYADKDGVVTKVGVSTDVVTGKITKIAGPSGKQTFTIGDKGYKISSKASTPGLGDEGSFFLNHKGEIAIAKADNSANTNYAIVLKEAGNVEGYLANNKQIYLLTKDGAKTVYQFKDLATYNDILNLDNNTGNNANMNDDVTLSVGDLITFKTNADGQIIDITKIAYVNDTNEASSLTDKGIMNGYLIADNVVVFDADANKETKDWGLSSVANLTTPSIADNCVYYDLNLGKISAIVIRDGAAAKSVTNLGFFTSKYDTFNAKNEEIFGGTMIQNGAVVDYTTVKKTDALTSAVAANNVLYKLTFKGADILSAEAATALGGDDGKTAPQKESDFSTTYDYTFYKDGNATDAAFASNDDANLGIFTNLYKVVKKADGTVDLGIADDASQAGDQSAPNYQYIGAAANAYKITIKYDATKSQYVFDKLVIGSASDVKKDAYVMLFQLDKKSGAWDTIVYLTEADAAKLPEAPQQGGNI